MKNGRLSAADSGGGAPDFGCRDNRSGGSVGAAARDASCVLHRPFPLCEAEIVVSDRGTGSSNPSPSSGESRANLTLGRFRGAVSSQDSVYRVCERVFESMLRFYDRHAAAELCVGHAQHVCASRFRRRGQQPAGN